MNFRFRTQPRQVHLIDLPILGLVIVTLMVWIAPFWSFADLFRQVWPVWMAGASVLTISAFLLRAPRRILVSVLSALVLAPALGPTFFAERGDSWNSNDRGQEVTFATHNLWGRNRAHDLTADVLIGMNADILALQESGMRTRAIHQALSGHYANEVTCNRAPVRIFSRLPVSESGCLRDILDENRSAGEPLWRWDFPAAVWARIELPDGETFVVISVHFTWPNPLSSQNEERINFAEIAQVFDQERLVILGDFNAATPSSALSRFDRDLIPVRRTHSMPTWPSQGRWTNEAGNTVALPTMFAGIDHIYAGERWITGTIEVGPNTGSDHRPVAGRLIFREAGDAD